MNTECNKYFDFNRLDDYVEFDKPLYSIVQKRKTARLLYLSPKEYLDIVAKGFGLSYENTVSHIDKDTVKKYADWMKEGKKAPIIYYTKDSSYQEGRHRALSAMSLGCNKIPVIEFRNISDKELDLFLNQLKGKSFEEVNSIFKEMGFDNGISILGYNDLQRTIAYRTDEVKKHIIELLSEFHK